MWNTSKGVRVLEGAEAKLLKKAVAEYVDNLREAGLWDEPEPTEYDWITVEQVARMEHDHMLHVFASVVQALLDPEIPAPRLTADTEAAVYQLYQFLNIGIEIEADMYDGVNPADAEADEDRFVFSSVRRTVGKAVRELGWCENRENGQCGDCMWCSPDTTAGADAWEGLVEMLADQVLWDRDWEMEVDLADADPHVGDIVKSQARIDGGYYTTPTEEPTPAQAAEAKSYLETIADEMGKGDRPKKRVWMATVKSRYRADRSWVVIARHAPGELEGIYGRDGVRVDTVEGHPLSHVFRSGDEATQFLESHFWPERCTCGGDVDQDSGDCGKCARCWA